MEKHTTTEHTGMEVKSVTKMVSLSESARVRQADAMFYSPYLHKLAEKSPVSDVHFEEKFKPPSPSTSNTPAALTDFASSEAKLNDSDILETTRGGMESNPQMKTSPSQAAEHEICTAHVACKSMSHIKQEISIQQLRDLLETTRGGMESKAQQIKISPCNSAEYELCTAHVAHESMSSIKQEISIQQLRDLLHASRDKGTSGIHASNVVQCIDSVKAEFIENLTREVLKLSQRNHNLIKTESSDIDNKNDPEYCLSERGIVHNDRKNNLHADEQVGKRLRRDVSHCNYKEDNKTFEVADLVTGDDDNNYEYCVQAEIELESNDVSFNEDSKEHKIRKQINKNPTSRWRDLNVSSTGSEAHRPCWKCFNKLVFCLDVRNNLKTVGDDSHDMNKTNCSTDMSCLGHSFSEYVNVNEGQGSTSCLDSQDVMESQNKGISRESVDGFQVYIDYEDSYANDMGNLDQQHRTGSRQTECRKDDDVQTMKDKDVHHACPLCKLAFSSDQYLEIHRKRRHSESSIEIHLSNIKNSMLKKSTVVGFDCFEDENHTLSKSVNCCTKAVAQVNDYLIRNEPFEQSMTSKEEESIKYEGSGQNASQSINLCSNATHKGDRFMECSECGKMCSQESDYIKNMEKIKEGHVFKCNECSSLSNLSNCHNNIHTEQPFTHNECHNMLCLNSCLKGQMRTHTGEKSLQCNECDKMFSESDHLKHHMKTHTGKNPFKCNECGKTFNLNSHLLTHMTTRTGKKPFKCNECRKTFRHSGRLHIQMRTHRGEKPFKCNECGKAFSESRHLKSHMRTHTGEKLVKCNESGKMVSQNGQLHTHMRTHTGKKPFKCKECGKTFSRSGHLHTHMRTHTGKKPFKCKECGKTFSRSGHLHTHMRTHTGKKSFKCKECDKTFSQSGHIHTHMRTHRAEKPFKCNECGKTFRQNGHLHKHMRTHTGEKPFKCTECGMSFSRSDILYNHMRTHTGEKPFKCNECGKTFSWNSQLYTHMRAHTGEKPFKCTECGMSFSRSDTLYNHMRTHTGEKPFKCNECGKTFSGHGQLYTHMRTHTGEEPFKCNECGKTFSYSSHLKGHIRTHTGEKPFKCNECGKMFSRNDHLQSHMRTHTGEKPFQCNECGKTFSNSSHLKSHKRTHTGEKPFKCNECGKMFSWYAQFYIHLRTHTGEEPFKCNECGKTFCNSSSLKGHIRTHTGEKPFKCNECGKTFSNNSHLTRHMRTHTGKKPFKCNECGKMFSQRDHLRTHMRIHAGEKPFKCK